jgi:hypothetical protein
MNIPLILAYWKLQRLRSEELPQIATDWMGVGMDSPALRELAGIEEPAMSTVGPLFERALRESGMHLPSRDEALMTLARHYAQQIVEGAMTPYEGARKIWWDVSNDYGEKLPILLRFVGAASEIEDLPERTLQDGINREQYIQELENLIMASAKELLKPGP